jgi:chromosome segregation ATPase
MTNRACRGRGDLGKRRESRGAEWILASSKPFIRRMDPMISLFGLPLSSSVLFILAGVLIGHLLWYHDRSAAKETVDGLEDRYSKAKGSARARRRDALQLQKEVESRQSDLDKIQLAYDAVVAEKISLDQQTQSMHSDLVRLSQEQHSLSDELADERRRNETIVRELQQALQLKAKTDSEYERLAQNSQSAQSEINERNQIIDSLRSDLDHLTKTSAQLQSELDQARSNALAMSQDNEQLRQNLANTSVEVEHRVSDLQKQLNEAIQQRESLVAQLNETQGDLVARCEDLDDLHSEMAQMRVDLAKLESDLNIAKQAANDRDSIASDLEMAADSMTQQRELIEARENEIATLNAEIKKLREQFENSRSEKMAVAGQLVHYESEIEQLQSRLSEMAPISMQFQTANEELQAERDQNRQLLVKVSAQTEQISQLQAKLLALPEIRTELDGIRAEYQLAMATVTEMKADSERAHHLLGVKEVEAERLNSQIEALKTELESLSAMASTLEPLRDNLEQKHRELAKLYSENNDQKSMILELQNQQGLYQQALSEIDRLKQEASDVEDRTSAIYAENEKLRSERGKLDQALAGLRDQVTSQAARFEKTNLSIKDLTERLQATQATLSAANQKIQSQEAKLAGIDKELLLRQQRIQQLQPLVSKVDDLSIRLRDLRAEYEDSLESNVKASKRIEELQHQAQQDAEKIRQLRRDRVSITESDQPIRKAA